MTNFADQWTPNGPFGIVKDTDVEGGFHVVADDTARNAIALLKQKVGMHVYVVATGRLWRLLSTGAPPLTSVNFADISSTSDALAHGIGCVGINACPVTFLANSVTIGVGTFYDFQGRKIDVTAPAVIDTTTLADGVHTVVWDGTLNSGAGGFDVGGVVLGSPYLNGAAQWRSTMTFAVMQKAGSVNIAVTECQIYATGSMCQEELSIGADAGLVLASAFGQQGNFSSLRRAFVFRCSYSGGNSSDPDTAPRRFAVYDQVNAGAALIDFDSWEFTDGANNLADDHLDGLHVYGDSITATTINRGTLRWGVDATISTAPFINFRNRVNSVRFTNLRFEYNGDSGLNEDNCWVKDPGQNFTVENCGFVPTAGTGVPLFCLTYYATSVNLGGDPSVSAVPGTRFQNCSFGNMVKGDAFHLATAGMTGVLSFVDCAFGGNTPNPMLHVVNIVSVTSSVDVHFRGGRIASFDNSIIESAATAGAYTISEALISAWSASAEIGPATNRTVVSDCTFNAAMSLAGAAQVVGCRRQGVVAITDDQGTSHAANDLGLTSFKTLNGMEFKGSSSLHNFTMNRGDAKSVLLHGKSDASGFVPYALELHPVEITANVAGVRVPNPGTVVVGFPDGREISWTPGADTDLNVTTATNLDDATTAQDYTVYYFFLRKSLGHAVDGLAYSKNQPQANGSLHGSDTPQVGRSATDYVFIGSLMTGDVTSNNPWGACRAAHLGNGLRRVWSSGPGDPLSPLYVSDVFASTVAAPFGQLAFATSLNTTLRTAREFEIWRSVSLNGGTNTSEAFAYVSLGSPNQDVLAASLVPSQSATLRLTTPIALTTAAMELSNQLVSSVPRLNMTASADYSASYVTGPLVGTDVAGTLQMGVVSWLENVNSPIPTDPPANDG